MGREETLRRYPGLAPRGPDRAPASSATARCTIRRGWCWPIVQSAVAAGAVCANYVEATGLIQRGGRVQGVAARDVLGGEPLEIRGRFVLNAAGPYAEGILAGSLGRG